MATKRTTLHRLRTRDGHEARIFLQTNSWLIHKELYVVQILSQAYYRGFRRAVIYGWTGIDLDTVKDQVDNWTADEIFTVNPYLRQLALNWTPPPIP